MAAALRALFRLPAASTPRLLPSSLPGPFPKLSVAASILPYPRGADYSPALFPSLLRRYCSARVRVPRTTKAALPGKSNPRTQGGGSVGGLASGRRAYASQLQVPSLLPVRHHGSASAKQLNSLEQFRDEVAMQFALEKLRNIDKSLTQLKRIIWLKVALLGLFLHAFYSLFFLLNLKVAALGEKVAELESRRIFERKIVQRSDLC